MPPKLELDAETQAGLDAMRDAEREPVEQAIEEPLEDPQPKDTEPKAEKEPEEKPDEKTVPLAALHEAREANKKLRAEFETKQRLTDERLAKLMEALNPQKKEEIPDPEKDAMGALKYTQNQLLQMQREQMQREQEMGRNQQIQMEAARLENEFKTTVDDYDAATQFLTQSRYNELLATGMYNQQQAMGMVQQEARQLAEMAIMNGKNPAEIAYNLSKARGFVKPKAVQQEQTEAEKLARVAAGQQASKSLGSTPAQAPGANKLDARTLANMSDDDFEKVFSKLTRSQRKELMGG
ncbi:MAG: hypothetical protein KGL39_24330 [Patescibacteria group bacterium]|nr:hypothetical protein [Patescibacteria group bacterium]